MGEDPWRVFNYGATGLDTLAHSKIIPKEDRDKIKKAVLDAHNYGEIGGYGGKMSHYMEVKDSDYNVLREVIELLNKNKS